MNYFESGKVHPAPYEPSGHGASLRVFRGGSFLFPAGYARSACRALAFPESRLDRLGFRPARRAEP